MAELKIPVVDRSPTYPGRVTLTPVSGQQNTYDMARADVPIVEGTPLNKELFDNKAYTLTDDATVYVNGSTGSDTTGDGTSSAPYKTIQKAVDSIPKCLGGFTATVSITAGTYAERVAVNDFYGGQIVIGVTGRTVTVYGMNIYRSSTVTVNISNFTYNASYAGNLLDIAYGSNVTLGNNMTFNGGSASRSGLAGGQGCDINGYNKTLTFTYFGAAAILASTGAKMSLETLNGTTSNTSYGIRAERGAVVTYVNRALSGTSGDFTNGGGRILVGAGTALANASLV